MRINLITLALVAFIVPTASAQKFNPGYYITSSGDTVKKDIQLQLKKGLIEKVVTPEGLFLAPKDIQGFGLNNVNYVVRKVSMDKTPDGGFVTDTVFLEVMNRGKISLLYMIDEDDKVHFYIENENGPQELTVRLNDQNDGIVVRRVETYKSSLKGIFPTCTDLFPAIDKTLFNRKGIQSIYEKLYKCRYQEAAPAMKKEQTTKSTDFGAYGGVTFANQHFIMKNGRSGINANTLTLMTFPDRSIDPTFGVYLETKYKRRRTFSARHELSYIQYEQTSDELKVNKYQTTSYYATVGAKYLRYSFILRGYFLPKSNVKPFVNAGITPMLALSVKHILATNPNGVGDPIFQKTNSATVAYFVGAGVTYNRFGLDLRYELLRGFSEEIFGRLKMFSFTLHYKIKTFDRG